MLQTACASSLSVNLEDSRPVNYQQSVEPQLRFGIHITDMLRLHRVQGIPGQYILVS